ncbi:MAG: ATP-binding protein [Desulfobacterales bacterium]|nr:ATP-binding protein [Desulfobacterales bacterium]
MPRTVRGDPCVSSRCLLNLIGNAIKFTDEGEITVQVGVTGEDDESVRVWVSVSDTGAGIAEWAQESIFDSFSQADSSPDAQILRHRVGTRHLTAALVEMMGGKTGVESTPGSGSTFRFNLSPQQEQKTCPLSCVIKRRFIAEEKGRRAQLPGTARRG